MFAREGRISEAMMFGHKSTEELGRNAIVFDALPFSSFKNPLIWSPCPVAAFVHENPLSISRDC